MLTREQIKDILSIERVIMHYGINISTHKRCLCPFHNDGSPSMVVNGRNNGKVRCFVCSKSWDIFDFIMEKEGIDINQTYSYIHNVLRINIGLDAYDKNAYIEFKNKIKIEQDIKEKKLKSDKILNDFKKKVINKVIKEYNKYNDICIHYSNIKTVNSDEEIQKYINAIKYRDYCFDLLSYIYESDSYIENYAGPQIEFLRKIYKGEYKLSALLI